MSDGNKKRYNSGCFCADWVDVEVNESSSAYQNYVRKDLATLLEELEEIKRNIERLAEKEIFLENLMRLNRESYYEY